MDIGKIFFTKRFAKHWKRFLRETKESSSLQVLKKGVAVALEKRLDSKYDGGAWLTIG